MTDNMDRRQLLKATGALSAVGLSGASAGCLSLLPPTGQQVRYGRVDVPGPTSDDPVYRKWIPADSELPDLEYVDSASAMHWQFVTPGNLGFDEIGTAFTIGASVIKSASDYVGYAFDSYDYALGLGSLGTVAEGEFDADAVAETMAKTDYEEVGTYRDYTLYDRTDIPRLVAVSESAIIQSRGENRQTKAETLVDAGDGRIERYHETDDDFATFSEWVGTYPSMMEGFWFTESDVSPEQSVMGYTFDEDAAYYIHHGQFAEGETPERKKLKQLIDENLSRARRAYSVDIEMDGRQVSVEIRMDETEVNKMNPEDQQPLVTWGVDQNGETVTIHHEAGDPIPTDKLEFEPVNAIVEKPAKGTRIEPGDTLTFDTGDMGMENRIRVTFHPDENTMSTLFGYDVDEDSPGDGESDTDT